MAGDGLYRCPAMRALPDPADYDDDRPRVEDALDEVLPGQNLATRWVDVDDADESDMERAFELAGADLAGEDVTVPVIRSARTNSSARAAFSYAM